MDPETKALMDAMEAAFPDVETMTGAEARAHMKQVVASLAIDPEPVARVPAGRRIASVAAPR